MAGRRLPPPEVIGFSGYVKWMGFDPVLSNVPFNHPSIEATLYVSNKLMCPICLYKYFSDMYIYVILKCTIGN
jgi:hypothetical protein